MKRTALSSLRATVFAAFLFAAGSAFCAKVPLTVAPGSNFPIVEGEIDGVKCKLLVDTGATHTTLDRGFLEKNLPGNALEPVRLGGVTNVKVEPSITEVKSFKLGEMDFGPCPVMVLDLAHVADASRRQLDGILGMNMLGLTRTIISLGGGYVEFSAPASAREGFAPARRTNLEDPLTITLKCEKPDATVFIDSGASFTFFPKDAGWPAASTNAFIIGATDVNVAGQGIECLPGVEGEITFPASDARIPAMPLLSAQPLNRIGSDTLKNCDILIEPAMVGFRRARKNETLSQ